MRYLRVRVMFSRRVTTCESQHYIINYVIFDFQLFMECSHIVAIYIFNPHQFSFPLFGAAGRGAFGGHDV